MFKKGYKGCFLVNLFTNQCNTFPHSKGSQHSADAKAGDMTKEEEGHAGCDGKAGDVIADFYSGVRLLCDIHKFTRKKVCWDNRQFSAVGKCNAEAKDEIAQHKIEDSQRDV